MLKTKAVISSEALGNVSTSIHKISSQKLIFFVVTGHQNLKFHEPNFTSKFCKGMKLDL